MVSHTIQRSSISFDCVLSKDEQVKRCHGGRGLPRVSMLATITVYRSWFARTSCSLELAHGLTVSTWQDSRGPMLKVLGISDTVRSVLGI
jgi:hypothetical protein